MKGANFDIGTDFLLLELVAPCSIKREDGFHVASCSPLDVHSQGESASEAKSNLAEAIQLFVETCIEQGTLDKVLADAGLHLASGSGHTVHPSKQIRVRVMTEYNHAARSN